MRFFLGLAFFIVAWGAGSRLAAAEPCPVYERFLVKTPNPQSYAIGFRSLEDGVADIDVTLYAGNDSYLARIPKVIFTRPGIPRPGYVKDWLSEATFVTLPQSAPPLESARLDIEEPSTHAPLHCTANVDVVDDFASGAKHPNDAGAAQQQADIARALASYSPQAPAVVATLQPPEPVANCARPNVDARTGDIADAVYPAAAKEFGHTGIVVVRVELSEKGTVLGTDIYKTSGFPELDASARDAATRTTYSPAIFHCRPVAGLYVFGVQFTGP